MWFMLVTPQPDKARVAAAVATSVNVYPSSSSVVCRFDFVKSEYSQIHPILAKNGRGKKRFPARQRFAGVVDDRVGLSGAMVA